ncbi:MAG: MliC family protein [Bacteroidota bacterium]
MFRTSFLFATLLLAGCENSPDVLDAIPDDAESPAAVGPHSGPAPITEATTYTCSGGDIFTATPLGEDRLELTRGEATLELERTASSMGARYVAGRTEVWISDEGAFVVENEVMVLADCTAAIDA